jgi:hypothetical protein
MCAPGYCARGAFRFITRVPYQSMAPTFDSMSEKPESDEFEEEDAEDAAPGGDDVDVDHIMRDVESQRRRAPKGAEPAWRRLERVMEERRTAELLSDFDDYEIGDDDFTGDGEASKSSSKKKHKRGH